MMFVLLSKFPACIENSLHLTFYLVCMYVCMCLTNHPPTINVDDLMDNSVFQSDTTTSINSSLPGCPKDFDQDALEVFDIVITVAQIIAFVMLCLINVVCVKYRQFTKFILYLDTVSDLINFADSSIGKGLEQRALYGPYLIFKLLLLGEVSKYHIPF